MSECRSVSVPCVPWSVVQSASQGSELGHTRSQCSVGTSSVSSNATNITPLDPDPGVGSQPAKCDCIISIKS